MKIKISNDNKEGNSKMVMEIKVSNGSKEDNSKMIKSEIYRKIIRLMTIFGGVIGFLYVFLRLYNVEDVSQWIQDKGIVSVIYANCGLLIAGFTIVTALKPGNPIPWHWITLIVLAALTTLFIHLLPAILIFIAGTYELAKEL
jgi:hypothetical protein